MQCRPERGLICLFSGIAFSVYETTEMGFAVMKGLRFGDIQESCFEAWKLSHMGGVALLCGRFADAQESCIEAANCSKIWRAATPVFNLLMLSNGLFRLLNVQIWAAPS